MSSAYQVRCLKNWREIAPVRTALARGGRATPFQTSLFLDAWYATLGAEPGVQPLIVEAVRKSDGVPALLLPLILQSRGALRVIGFADGSVADNNAPVLGPACPPDETSFQPLWQAILASLPPADLIAFEKMPLAVGGRANPLLSVAPWRPSILSAHPLHLPGVFEDYSRSRATKFRKEQERVWRVFTRAEGARFDMIADPAEGLRILGDIDRLQGARMRDLGAPFTLDQPPFAAMYRRLVADGLASGGVELGALTCKGETVGALLGISDGRAVTLVRIAHAGGAWTNCSPGRLVIERMMMALHERGIRRIDFSIGDYGYKENFNIGWEPLADMALPLTWRAWPSVAAGRAKAALRRSPLARRLRDGMRRKRPRSAAR